MWLLPRPSDLPVRSAQLVAGIAIGGCYAWSGYLISVRGTAAAGPAHCLLSPTACCTACCTARRSRCSCLVSSVSPAGPNGRGVAERAPVSSCCCSCATTANLPAGDLNAC